MIYLEIGCRISYFNQGYIVNSQQNTAMDSFFEAFPSVTKKEWLQQVEKELKGKPFEDLQWMVGDSISVDPFYVEEDIAFEAVPQVFPTTPKGWKIGESFFVSDPIKTNPELLVALQGGVNAPGFHFASPISTNDFFQLYKDVSADFISHHFELEDQDSKNGPDLLEAFHWFLKESNLDTNIQGTLLSGGIDHLPNQKNWNQLASFRKVLPGFRCIGLDISQTWNGRENTIEEVIQLLKATVEYLEKATDSRDWSVLEFFQNLFIKVNIGTSYFLEIAKLRAIRLVLANLQKAYGLETLQYPWLDVHFAPQVMDENPNTNMIKDTTMALAGIIGGATRLTVLPANANLEEPTAFTRRIARNVQHLLELEAQLGKVNDPAAGSYYIEKLTGEIAEKAWNSIR